MIKKQLTSVAIILLMLTSFNASAGKAKAPNFKLPGIKSQVNLASYRGKVVYVDFWASWCGPCRKSFPWMSDIQRKYGKSLKVIAVNLDEERKDAVDFLKKTRPKFTVAFDPTGKVAAAYKIKAMPSSFLIDQNGRIISAHTGFRGADKQKVEDEIQKLISRRLSAKL